MLDRRLDQRSPWRGEGCNPKPFTLNPADTCTSTRMAIHQVHGPPLQDHQGVGGHHGRALASVLHKRLDQGSPQNRRRGWVRLLLPRGGCGKVPPAWGRGGAALRAPVQPMHLQAG